MDEYRAGPPRGLPPLVPRDALLARLQEARRQRCVVLQGPAGSGKTCALAAWRQELLPLDFDVAWLALGEQHRDPARFLGALLGSLAEVDAAMVVPAASLPETGFDAGGIDHWVLALSAGIAAHPRELVLMIDDLQHAEDPHVLQVLQGLLDHSPPQLHLVLASRKPMPLRLARLRAQGRMTRLDLRDLAFSLREVEAFLRARLGDADHRAARVLHRRTGGWVAGLMMLAPPPRVGARAMVPPSEPDALLRYFESEVLAPLPAQDIAVLTAVSICDSFTAALAATLMGHPDATARLEAQLQVLAAGRLVEPLHVRAGETWYRLQQLLREVLQARLDRESEARRRGLHARAAHWFRHTGQVVNAVGHMVSAGEVHAAANGLLPVSTTPC